MKASPAKMFGLTTAAVLIASVSAFFIDSGRFQKTFEDGGLPAFAALPSVLVCQVGVLLAFAILLPFGLSAAKQTGNSRATRLLRISSVCASLGAIGCILAVLGIAGAARAGEFGNGAAGVLAIFVLFPSTVVLVVAA